MASTTVRLSDTELALIERGMDAFILHQKSKLIAPISVEEQEEDVRLAAAAERLRIMVRNEAARIGGRRGTVKRGLESLA